MSELNSKEMEPVTGGHKSMREIPNELIKLYCQKLKSQGVGMEEAVIAVIKYYTIPISEYNAIRAYVMSIWNSI